MQTSNTPNFINSQSKNENICCPDDDPEHLKFVLTICCALTYPPTLKTLMTVTKYSHDKNRKTFL